MGLYWNPYAVIGSVGTLLGIGLAAFIFLMNPGRAQNRYLALFMALLSTGMGVAVGWMFASDDVPTSMAFQAVGLVGYYMAVPAYLLFLGTLGTPITDWLRRPPVRFVLWAWMAAVPPLVLAGFDRIVGGIIEVPYAKFDSYWTSFGTRLFEVNAVLTATFGVAAAVVALVRAPPGTLTRIQARWYLAAFGFWEVAQLTAFTLLEIAFAQATPSVALYTAAAGIIMPVALLVFILLLALAIFKAQLFDIDLKLKVGLRRSFIIAPFAVAFFVAAETLEGFVPFESYWLGLAAAGVLSLAFVPLQRGAARLADRLMPGVDDTAAYRDARAQEIYQAALDAATQDGEVTIKEQAMLDRLAQEFGLEARSA